MGCDSCWSFAPYLQACDGPCRFLQCVGLPAHDTGKEHMQRLKAIMEATLDLYTFMVRFLLRSAHGPIKVQPRQQKECDYSARTECSPVALCAFVYVFQNLNRDLNKDIDIRRNRFLSGMSNIIALNSGTYPYPNPNPLF